VPHIVCVIGNLYLLLVFARVLLSWLQIPPGSGFAPVASFIYRATEPVLGPLRRAIPPARMGAMALDLSPLIVLIGGQILLANLCR
jgi:YggT family protein